MIIYTGNADGDSLDKVEEMGLGIMVASSATWEPRKGYSRVPCALDNGAFQCWRRGFPFMADVFRRTLSEAYRVGLSLDFIVCPDMVARGKTSLDFSMSWAKGELVSTPRLALAVQDGMEPQNLADRNAPRYFSHVFIGGTVEWKWQTAQQWIDWAHAHDMKCHIGQCGTLERITAAHRMGADSVDSTSIVRNQAWHIIEAFRNSGHQEELKLSAD